MQDNNYCVYVHYDNDSQPFYVGHGRPGRAKLKSKSSRSPSWAVVANLGFTFKILEHSLSKDQALDLEQETILKLRAEGYNLVNKKLPARVRHLTKEMFEKHLEVDDDSPYGLRWIDSGKVAGVKTDHGYCAVHFQGKNYFAHRIVVALTNGECPANLQVNHIDGNKANNKIENLELVTPSQNVKHSFDVLKRSRGCGEDNAMALLTEDTILKIVDDINAGLSNTEISNRYDVEHKNVSQIRYKKRWKHLLKDIEIRKGKSRHPNINSKSQINLAWYLTKNTDMSNVEIAQLTAIERSQISRIRHNKTYQQFIKEFEES